MTTPLWNRQDLCAATGGTLEADVAVQGVSIDTRQIQPGDLFIALIGHHSDGHRFITQAFEKGAACVMVHDNTAIAAAGMQHEPRLLRVTDTFHALEALGRFARARFRGTAVAVTGSVGKTTTKEMLRTALTPYGTVHASVASYNNHWGVPLTLARLPKEARFCISEVGMNHPGEITPLAALIQPERVLVTTIGSAHLGHMGSLEAIAREKASLLAALPSTGLALIPDDAAGQSFFEKTLPSGAILWRCGMTPEATIRLDDLHCTAEGSRFQLHTPEETHDVSLTAPGAHLARNAALVLGVVTSFHLPLHPAIKALHAMKMGAGRGQHRRLKGDVLLLDESYNASGPSMHAALETLALMPARRHLAALGDILELGAFAEAEHRTLAEPIITHNVLCFCCGTHMKTLYNALPPSLRGGYAPDAAQLVRLVRHALHPGDALLVKGSFGSRMRDLIAGLEAPSPSASTTVSA